MSINCHSVCVWYIGDMLVICTSALESTHTQQDYNLGLNEKLVLSCFEFSEPKNENMLKCVLPPHRVEKGYR